MSEALLLPLERCYWCLLGGASSASGEVKVLAEFGERLGLLLGAS